ncbi:M16 family metallopeptidase [Dyadobacter sp. 32]|uniref:M16 family metallopeptidase n=1 Tax=Dyadobacter sp. 32 TaxID=538966 RepID=UPI0011F07E5E
MKRCILLLFTLIIHTSSHAQPSFQLPPYEEFKLKNGITVYLMEQHEVPLINVSAVFDAGSINDGSRYGLASLTADAMLFGTQKYSKEQIEERIDFAGASLATYAGKDVGGLSASFAAKDQDQLLDLIQQVLVYPVFNSKEIAKHKQRTLLQLSQQKESPQSVIGAYFNSFVYRNFPYANPTFGTKSTIESISDEEITAFYKTNYTTGKAAIAVVGDFKTAVMKKKITALFEGWKTAGPRMVKRVAPDLSFDKSRVLLVNKDDAKETTFLIGGKGVDYLNPDYVPILVINTILGGRFTSWLNDALRVNSGLTYGAFSQFARNKYAGTFNITTFTKKETTVPAIDMALAVLDSLHKTGIDETTLLSAKAYVKGDFPPNYESGGALAHLLTDMYAYNFDKSFINTFQKKVDELTASRASEIIRNYFPSEHLQFVMIGKASEIREQVKKYGEISEKQIKADGF